MACTTSCRRGRSRRAVLSYKTPSGIPKSRQRRCWMTIRAASSLSSCRRGSVSGSWFIKSMRNHDSGGTTTSGCRFSINRSMVVPDRSAPTMKNGLVAPWVVTSYERTAHASRAEPRECSCDVVAEAPFLGGVQRNGWRWKRQESPHCRRESSSSGSAAFSDFSLLTVGLVPS